MATTESFQFVVRDMPTIRDGFLRTIRYGLQTRGIAAPNVTPGSDWFILGQAVANQLVVVESNAAIKADELMPDTATGDALKRICSVFGISAQAAAGSVGPIITSSSASITITLNVNDKLLDGNGFTFRATPGIYPSGTTVTINAIDLGEKTNHDAGDVLRWVSTPTFSDEKVLVGAGGLVNGVDAEDEETLRARLYAVLQSPPLSGNSEYVTELAEFSSSAVQKAFVYPAIQGPGSFHTASVAAPLSTSKTRVLSGTIVSSIVSPYIQANYPEHAFSVNTGTLDVNSDVAFGLVLPEAPTASPPGPGGGWTNGVPWPAPDNSTTFRCTVTAVTSTTIFTVDAATSPTVGVSKICFLDPTPGVWALSDATVVAVSGTSGAYVITLDKPFANIAIGCMIWPHCANAQAYVDAVLGAYKLMGPGEKTTNASALIRGFRHPRPAQGWPYALSGHLTKAITDAQSEVSSAQFLHRTDGTTTLTGSGGTVNPQVPASVATGPNIFVPRHLGFYRLAA